MTHDGRGVEVQGGWGRCEPRDRPPDHGPIEGAQGLQRWRLGRDPSARDRALRHLRLVVEAREEVVQGIGRWEAAVQQACQTGVARQHADILDTVPSRRLDQDDRLELVELRIAALARPEPQARAHEIVHAQREERLGDERQARVRGQIHGAGRHFDSER